MVYLRNGEIVEKLPLYERISGFFVAIYLFVVFFFKSLIGMETKTKKNSQGGGSFFGGSSGGGGGPNGPGGGPRFRSMSDINPRTVSGGTCGGGGCSGGSCG